MAHDVPAAPLSSVITFKPAYVYRPDQIVRRMTTRRAPVGSLRVVLPWGLPTVVSSSDDLGRGIIRRNVHELPVTEAMWRLTGQGDLAVDVGANTGYFTSLLACRAQAVLAFEAHPVLASRLRSVIDSWPFEHRDKVTLHARAVSDRDGMASLSIPSGFARNEGLATLSPAVEYHEALDVPTVTLDAAVGGRPVGVLKIDIEGHELPAFQGARGLLGNRYVRDIFFEEHDPLPTPVSRLLLEYGYSIFGLRERARGVELTDPAGPRPRWDAPTFLATLDPVRAHRRITPNGWNSLRPRCPMRRQSRRSS